MSKRNQGFCFWFIKKMCGQSVIIIQYTFEPLDSFQFRFLPHAVFCRPVYLIVNQRVGLNFTDEVSLITSVINYLINNLLLQIWWNVISHTVMDDYSFEVANSIHSPVQSYYFSRLYWERHCVSFPLSWINTSHILTNWTQEKGEGQRWFSKTSYKWWSVWRLRSKIATQMKATRPCFCLLSNNMDTDLLRLTNFIHLLKLESDVY